jgi:hypothetical protein
MTCQHWAVLIISFLLFLSPSSGFQIFVSPRSSTRLPSKLNFSINEFTDLSSLMTAIDTKPDNYEYGAVAAPDWVLPLGAFLVILTAAIPILLKPGEEALDQQRENEKITNNKFNKKQNKDL